MSEVVKANFKSSHLTGGTVAFRIFRINDLNINIDLYIF